MPTETLEELDELAELVEDILTSTATTLKIRALEQEGGSWDPTIWKSLAESGILGVALPESVGGMDLGLDAVRAVLTVQGKFVAPVPLWSTLVSHRSLAASEAFDFTELLESAVSGDVRVTLALEENDTSDLHIPHCSALEVGESWVLTGTKTMVPHFASATHVLVSASTLDGLGMFLIPKDGPGISWERSLSSNRDEVGLLQMTEVSATPVHLGMTDGAETCIAEALIALAAFQIGVAKGALELTSAYVSEREQFGRPIGSFQSLQHLLADSSIQIDAAELVLSLAIVDLASDDMNAERSILVASWWGREAVADTVYRCQHVHGGMGADIEYPIHRFFLVGRQSSLTLGNSELLLERVGNMLISE